MAHESPSEAAGRPRIAALDVVRGFALCGILLANVQPIANAGDVVLEHPVETTGTMWLGLLVHQRFFAIFSLLFGIGFSLLLDSAAGRTPSPRLLLLRRLLVLLGMGLIHMFALWQGDILTIYAVVGLVVLLPSTWLPRWAVAGLAAVLIAVAAAFGGFTALVPGLFLAGSALTRYGVVDRMERSSPVLLTVLFGAVAVPVLWLQAHGHEEVFAVAGLLVAGFYVCGLLVLLRTPLRPALQVVFAPLGRMALTNYLSATILVLLISQAVDGPPDSWPLTTVFAIAGAILASQWLLSTLWLRRYRYGPMEWLWRWATWLRRPAMQRIGPARVQ
ncbi:DUF418 domain-containing protein [Nonomuraea sp. CA-141351]|uniref:DUF418 domain-containing protein n=1 Tax=Nonomuraea sp. CA-141351 TaxID=3239996 RepID=UPI003D8E406A